MNNQIRRLLPLLGMCGIVSLSMADDEPWRTCTYFGAGANKIGTNCVSIGVASGIPRAGEPASNVSIGYGAGTDSYGNYRISIGDSAGAQGQGAGIISIGTRAGYKTSGIRSVFIGDQEMTNQHNVISTTSINGKQIYINGETHEFSINPNQDEEVTDAPLYYKDGRLHINAPLTIDSDIGEEGTDLASASWAKQYIDSRIYHTSETKTLARTNFDLYMAPYGNDTAEGNRDAPKLTFEGCIEALGSDGGTVCVYPGVYRPISLVENEDGSILYAPTGNCRFVAIGGKETTSIIGIYTSTNGYDDGIRHTLAFSKGNQTFEGFTISKIGCYRKNKDTEGYISSAPALSCVTLKDCDIIDCKMRVSGCYGAFNTCYLDGVNISCITIDCYSNWYVDPEVFLNCAIINSSVTDCVFTNYDYSILFGTATECYYSAFSLPKEINNEDGNMANCKFEHCTFIWDTDNNVNALGRVSPLNAINCYFCVGTGAYSGGTSNVFSSVTNTYLSANLVPNNIDCPAVRGRNVRDAGWKDSGLGTLKELYQRVGNSN